MAMKRCPVCGERYSDTYKNCPFCEEDELWEEEEPHRPAKGRHSTAHGTQYSLITPTLIVLILLMAALLVYLLYGDKIAQRFSGGENDTPDTEFINPQEPTPGGSDTLPGEDDEENPNDGDDSEDNGASGNAGVMPEEPDSNGQDTGSTGTTSNGSGAGSDYNSLSQLPNGLTLSNPDFTRSVSEGAYRLRVSGGSGTYTWVSENPAIATVDSDGNVKPVASGTVHILVTDGSKKAIGTVRVSGGSTTTSSDTSSTGSAGANTLNREDMTISVGEKFRLELSGVTTNPTWSVANSSVATVSGDGTVTGVSAGMTTVTVSWDGQSKSCIVRVK